MKTGVIPIYMADIDNAVRHPGLYREYKGVFPPKRNYLDILLLGNSNSDDLIKLGFAKIVVRDILSERNTKKGVHFQFTDTSNYGAFVSVVDLLRSAGAITYMPTAKDIWFYYLQPEVNRSNNVIQVLVCGNADFTDYLSPQQPYWQEKFNWLAAIWKNAWETILSFLAFTIISIILRKKSMGAADLYRKGLLPGGRNSH